MPEPALDEIQWYSPQHLANMGQLHSNNILFYFAESPFFERTSNNQVIFSQAMTNPHEFWRIQTREAFESSLREMSGLEFIVGEEPAESGPGMGTGVWVIRKQVRRKIAGDEDQTTILSSYFIVGEHIYQAPKLGDILSSRLLILTNAISSALPKAQGVRKWRPSVGHTYPPPKQIAQPRTNAGTHGPSKEGTPMPDAAQGKTGEQPAKDDPSLDRSVEEAFAIHMRYGGEYVDENPITGRPGEFHLSSTGRKPVPPPQTQQTMGMSGPTTLDSKVGGAEKKDGKEQSGKSSTGTKPRKRKRNKGSAATTPAATTPAA
ncbi:Mediator of RNA polymerase II transcription subunit-like protein [Emericellopsis cladophorae]|uniref:Mediator of RNA polymerase II transcription subunit 6 n=1 Tax=Emericellopsis cladophorae TaxID=2686198 RepID=A0A9Q0BEG5_9HYPO|nr:Mediator of RNA polymerase II transcription subunit-like protein [Emericellopsis cladophorae]KAI6782422.1 Mediator of RNA polymerase II transcription subunit-like protein [Emericellopsis cladophorae]